jgi:methyl-accepting chemotaxis protein
MALFRHAEYRTGMAMPVFGHLFYSMEGKMSLKKLLTALLVVSFVICANGWAKTPDELAAESTAYCLSTATTKPTPEMIMAKVDQAAGMLKKEGAAAFPKFMGKGSDYLFAGTYIWINDLNGVILMHPIKNKLVGRNMTGIKDRTGKRFIAVGVQLAEEQGSGWVGYMWPKPGEKQVSPKVSYVKKVRTPDGDMVLGCGVYGMDDQLREKGYKVN